MPLTRKAYRAAILHSIADPAEVGLEASHEYYEDGLLVVDETNIETHGMGAQLSKDPAWAPVYLERAERMVLRDRNNPCIGFWSLGNESGSGANQAAITAGCGVVGCR